MIDLANNLAQQSTESTFTRQSDDSAATGTLITFYLPMTVDLLEKRHSACMQCGL